MLKIAALVLVLAGLAHCAFPPAFRTEGESSRVPCDANNSCPSSTKCCRHPSGIFTCCVHPDGVCCLDGAHCCPIATYCDTTFSLCLRQGLRYPFAPRVSSAPIPSMPMIEATNTEQMD